MRQLPKTCCLLSISLLSPLGSGQEIDVSRVVADSNFGSVKAGEFYREIALKYGREKRYIPLLHDLVKVEIVLQEMAKAGIKVDDRLIRQRIDEARESARAKGRTLEDLIKEAGLTLDTMKFYTMVSIAKEMLAARAFGEDMKYISRAKVNLWFNETMKKYEIRENLDHLENGIAAKVNGRSIPLEKYGWVISASLRKTNKNLLKQVICSIISGRRIRELAEKEGIKVTDEDIRKEVERRKRNVKEDPKWHGASLSQLLETKGMSIEILKNSRAFRDFILLKKLMWKIYPKEKQVQYFKRHEKEYLDHFGERRHLWHIAIGSDPGGRERGLKRALELKKRIKGETSFKLFARIYSSDKVSGPRGGDLGYVYRKQKGMPEKLLEAAFSLEKGKIGGPVEINGVFHIIMVTEIIPPPPMEEMLKHVRADLRRAILREILDQARIKYFLD